MPKDSNIPRYKVIEKDILDKINSQYYKIKETIPTEKELADEYHVSRVTVRKATDSLVMKGLLKRVAGSGTYVQDSPAHQKFPRQIGFTKEMVYTTLLIQTTIRTKMVILSNFWYTPHLNHHWDLLNLKVHSLIINLGILIIQLLK